MCITRSVVSDHRLLTSLNRTSPHADGRQHRQSKRKSFAIRLLTPAARQSGLYVRVDDFGFLRWGVSEPPEPVQPTICRMVIFYRTDTFRVPTLKKT